MLLNLKLIGRILWLVHLIPPALAKWQGRHA
jgi:hypothetical protein